MAGPCVTVPVAENSLPWHGHVKVSPVMPTTQPRCVQMSEYTVYLPFRFWTAAGWPFTMHRGELARRGRCSTAPTLTTWPMAPETAAGGLRNRAMG